MRQTLVVVTDLGTFKAFRRVIDVADSRAHLELLEHKRHEELRHRLSEQVTDSAGRFSTGAGRQNVGSSNMSVGERHNIRSEQQRRAVQSIANELNALLHGDEFAACWLAISQPMHHQLLEVLEPSAKGKIQKTLGIDLTKTKTPELLAHFEAAL